MFHIDTMGELVSEIGLAGFGRKYFEFANQVLGIAQCTAFAFSDAHAPCSLVLEGACADQRDFARTLGSAYVAGEFRQDPNIQNRPSHEPVIYASNASAVADSGYRRRFYEEPNLEHELVILGEAGDAMLYTSFYRSAGSSAFAPGEMEAVRLFAGFTLRALKRHLELQGDPAGWAGPSAEGRPDQAVILKHLAAVLVAEGHGLSPREAEVCASIVLGYGTLAISLNLGISENTVATHRKRAYAKLGVSSQNELFTRYFKTVSRLQGGALGTH